MNHTITLPELVKLLAETTNCSETTAQQFVTELFSTVTNALADGKTVKIKNIGTFALDGLNSDEIKYLPDPDLAEAINHPFAFFEPVELDDEITEEELATADAPAPAPMPAETETIAEDAPDNTCDNIDNSDNIETSESTESSETPDETPTNTIGQTIQIDPPIQSHQIVKEMEDADERNEPSPHIKHGLNPWLMFAIGLLTGVVVGYLLPTIKDGVSSLWTAPYEFVEPNQPVLPAQNEPVTPDLDRIEEIKDSTDNVAKTAAQQTLTDTIGRNRFLTTMARKYYGRYEFWVYIYEENASRLSDPDKIAPGTVVNIPPAEKYGINPDDPKSLSEATRKAAEIYEPYQK